VFRLCTTLTDCSWRQNCQH